MRFLVNFLKKNLTVKLYKVILLITSYSLITFAVGFLVAHSKFISAFKYDLQKLKVYKTITLDKTITTWIDNDETSHNGLVLISPHFFDQYNNENPALMLVNKNGEIIHKWFFKYKEDIRDKNYFKIDHFKLYENGDVIIMSSYPIHLTKGKSELTKMDKNSNIIWQIKGNFHHWFDIQKTGLIYALTQQTRPLSKMSPNLDFSDKKHALHSDNMVLTINSDTGKIINEISISKAFLNSDYYDYLNLSLALKQRDINDNFDILHSNTVKYLDKNTVKNLPFAQEGDLLLSFRQMDLIAILRPNEEKIVWAQRGPWRAQHHVELLPDGKIMLFDNEGGSHITNRDNITQTELNSRLLEFDPKTKSTKTIFHDNKEISFFSHWLSGFQELDNGHFIIFFSEKSRIIEIDKKGNIVWELRGVKNRNQELVHYLYKIPQATYFKKSQLNFLN